MRRNPNVYDLAAKRHSGDDRKKYAIHSSNEVALFQDDANVVIGRGRSRDAFEQMWSIGWNFLLGGWFRAVSWSRLTDGRCRTARKVCYFGQSSTSAFEVTQSDDNNVINNRFSREFEKNYTFDAREDRQIYECSFRCLLIRSPACNSIVIANFDDIEWERGSK